VPDEKRDDRCARRDETEETLSVNARVDRSVVDVSSSRSREALRRVEAEQEEQKR
jgi:hypothetical protein|tara:strand:+ start:896 stop:1060 length:165 start_codon:yes stop_codon:yes gene_type:complete